MMMLEEMLTCEHVWNIVEIVGVDESLYEIWCEACKATPESLAFLLAYQGKFSSFTGYLHFKIVLKGSIIDRSKKEGEKKSPGLEAFEEGRAQALKTYTETMTQARKTYDKVQKEGPHAKGGE